MGNLRAVLAAAWRQDPGLIAGAWVVQGLIIGCLFCYGVFLPAIEAETGWSRGFLSLASTALLIGMGVLAFPAGALVDRFGPRLPLRVGALCLGAGMLALGLVAAPWQLLAGYALLLGLALAVHDVATLSPVARQFPAARGPLTGIVKTGTAAGQVLLPAVAAALIAAVGWRAAAIAIGLLAGLALWRAAGAIGEYGDGPSAAPQTGCSLAEARRGRTLWSMCAIQFCFFPTLLTLPVHLVPHAIENGLSAGHAALLLSTIGASSAFGRLSVGVFFERLGGRGCLLLCLSLLLAALVWLRAIDGASLFAFAALYGYAHGGLFTAVSPTVASYFGMRAHAALYGMVLLCGTISGASIQYLSGYWHDLHGDYALGFNVLSALLAASLLLAAMLPSRAAVSAGGP